MGLLVITNTEVYTAIGAGIFAVLMVLLIAFTRRGT